MTLKFSDIHKSARVIMMSGASIYLVIFGLTMSFGTFTWHADFLGTHGEPFLVIGLGIFAAIEAYWVIRKK